MGFLKQTTLTAVVLLLVASSPARAQVTDLSNAEIATRVQTVIDRALARPEAVGLSVAVARGEDVIVEQGVGYC